MSIRRSRASKIWDAPDFRARKFCLQIYNEKVKVNSKYYREDKYTCDFLMFVYLMASKETFNSFTKEIPII